MSQYNGIINENTMLTQDWGAKDAQWSGQQVQDGIKAGFKSKVGHICMYNKYICAFRNKEDYEKWNQLGASEKLGSALLLSYTKIKYEDLTNKATVTTLGSIGDTNFSEIVDSITLTKEKCVIKNLQFVLSGKDDEENDIDFSSVKTLKYHISLNNKELVSGICSVGNNNIATITDDIDIRNNISGNNNSLLIWVEFSHNITGVVSTELAGNLAFNVRLNDFKLSFANDSFWQTPFYLKEDEVYSLGLNISGSFGEAKYANLSIQVDGKEIYSGQFDSNSSSASQAKINYKYTNAIGDSTGYYSISEGTHQLTCQYEVNGVYSPIITKNVLFLNPSSDGKFICTNLTKQEFNNYSVSEICKCLVYGNEEVVYYVQVDGNSQPEMNLSYEPLALTSINFNFQAESTVDILSGYLFIKFKSDQSYTSNVFSINNNANNRFDAILPNLTINIDPASQSSNSNILSRVNNITSEIPTEWQEVTWGASDGYILENINNTNTSVLKILKNQKAILTSDFLNTGEAFTFEIMYKITNNTNLDDVAVSYLKKEGQFEFGLKVFSERIEYQANSNATSLRSIPLKSDEIIHLVIAYSKDLNQWGNFPMAKIYVNGKIAGELNNEAASLKGVSLVLGGSESNLSIYKIRTYSTMLSDYNVFKNYLNCLGYDPELRIALKEANNKVYNETEADKSKISYASIRDAGLNCFVLSSPTNTNLVEELGRPQKSVLPGRGNDNKVTDALIELYWDKSRYPNNDNIKIQLNGNDSKKAYLRYQGTSSKDYYRWNWRTNFSKDSTITYLDKFEQIEMTEEELASRTEEQIANNVTTKNGDNIVVTNSSVDWYTLDNVPFKCSYIAAKKNAASSMQSHKIGFTSSYQDLYDKLIEKGLYPSLKSDLLYGEDGTRNTNRVSIYQYPFFGFVKGLNAEGQETYQFVGLYTLGPDKGDTKTSGLSDSKFPNILQIEGQNNDSGFANMSVPFEEIYYNSDDETLHAGVDQKDNNKGIEITSISDSNSEDDGVEYFKAKFGDAYKCVYNNSINIEYAGTSYNPEEVHSNKTIYKIYWFGDPASFSESHEVKFYYVNKLNKLVEIPEQTKTYNLYGKSPEEANGIIIESRAQAFKDQWGNYFVEDDILFWFVCLEINSGTDERGKNIYLYNLGTENDNKWRARIDDTDTRLHIDNQGDPTIKYSIEIGDNDQIHGQWDNTSQLLALLNNKVFYSEKAKMFSSVIECMCDLGGESNPSIVNVLKFYEKYFWKNVCEYFTHIGYGSDAYFTYDQAQWVLKNPKTGFEYTNGGVDPVKQLLGDSVLPEKNFITKRLTFLAAKYKYHKILGVLDFGRNIKQGTFNIQYSDDVYPIYFDQNADNLTTTNFRYSSSDIFTFNVSSESFVNTGFGPKEYVKKIESDWSNVVVGEGSSIEISGLKNLTEFQVNSFSENIIIRDLENLTKLNITDCPKITTVDVSKSLNLKELQIVGESLISEITLPSGAPLATLAIPSSVSEIYLQDLQKLTGYSYSINPDALRKYLVVNCAGELSPINKLFSYIDAGCVLTNFYISGINETWSKDNSKSNLTKLVQLAQYIDSNKIKGYIKSGDRYVVSEEDTSKPSLSGIININCDYYINDLDAIQESITGDLQIVPAKGNNKFIRFNWEDLNQALLSWLISGGYHPSVEGLIYQVVFAAEDMGMSGKTVLNLLTRYHTNTAGLASHPLSNILSKSDVDMTDWGKRFPNKMPTFLRGNDLSNANLNIMFDSTGTVNLGQIAPLATSRNEYAYSNLNIQGPDISINGVLLEQTLLGATSSIKTKLTVDNLKIKANSLKFIQESYTEYQLNSSGTERPDGNYWQNNTQELKINNLYIDCDQVPTAQDSNLIIAANNVYVNQNTYWGYIESTNLYKRIEQGKYYIPYNKDRATNIPKVGQYDQARRILSGVAYYSMSTVSFPNIPIVITFAAHKLNRTQYLLDSDNISIYINEVNRIVIQYKISAVEYNSYTINETIKLNEIYTIEVIPYYDSFVCYLNTQNYEVSSKMYLNNNSQFAIGSTQTKQNYLIGSIFSIALGSALITPTESGFIETNSAGQQTALNFVDGYAAEMQYLTTYIPGV